jgi:hypothetical protein
MGGTGQISIVRALGNATQCDTTAIMGVTSTTSFTESKPGWLYVTRDTTKPAESIFIAVDNTHNRGLLFDEYLGGRSHATERAFLTPGSFSIPEWILAVVAGPGGGGILKHGGGTLQRRSLDTQMAGTFYAAGSAYGGTSGAARRFVRFPGSISCTHHKATLTWKSGASRVAGGSFSVNGKKKASVSNPRAGGHVVLRHLSRTADTTITAHLSLEGGGHASAARQYVPCAG